MVPGDTPAMVMYVLMVQLHNVLILLIIIKKEKCIRTFEGGHCIFCVTTSDGPMTEFKP